MYEKDKMNELLKKEERIEAHEIAEQLLPIMKDFFVGEFCVDDNSLQCSFLNGDKFKITVYPIT